MSQQHLVSVLRKMQAGTSAIMVTEEAMMTSAMMPQTHDNNYHENTAHDDPSPVFTESSPSLSPEALHILQTLETSGFEGTPTEESDAINSLIDQLPLSNFMTKVEPVDNLLHTRVGSRNHEVKSIAMKVRGTFEQMTKSYWDSCASACFESSLEQCVPSSFIEIVKKIVTADGGCNSDGMAWRRYHILINDEWIALGDEYGLDLRQADVITFAMPTIVATKFPTSVSIVAAPVAKGLLISTKIAAGYHEQDSIMLHQRPDLAYPLLHTANGLPYAVFVDDKIVRARGLRMVSHSDLQPYSDEKAMQILSAQWHYHDPTGTYWTIVQQCYTLMTVGCVPRSALSSDNSSSTVFDSHSVPSEARVLTCKPSLKTVDSLFFTGEKEHARKSVSFAEQHSLTQRKRTKADTGSIDGPAIYITPAECELLSKLLFSQNATSLPNGDVNSPLYQSLPLNVKYIVDVESSLTVCAHGADITKFNDPVILVWNLNDKQTICGSISNS